MVRQTSGTVNFGALRVVVLAIVVRVSARVCDVDGATSRLNHPVQQARASPRLGSRCAPCTDTNHSVVDERAASQPNRVRTGDKRPIGRSRPGVASSELAAKGGDASNEQGTAREAPVPPW